MKRAPVADWYAEPNTNLSDCGEVEMRIRKDAIEQLRVSSGDRGGHRRSERGYVLLTMGASAIALFAALGMAVDVGRMYIAKAEVQAFSDSVALTATLQLNAADTGI